MLTIKQNIVFIFYLIVALIHKINPIDIKYFEFILVGAFFISTLFFKMSFAKKIIMAFLFSVFCTVRTSFKIKGFTVNLRAEDFLAVVMGIYLIYAFIRKEFKVKKIDIIILAYIVYNAIVLIVNCKLKNNEPMYFMIWLKEVQYFIYFVFFRNALKEKKELSFIMQVLVYCSTINIIWGIYQVVNKSVSYYGISCMPSTAPAHSGGLYFIVTLVMLYLFASKNNYFYLVMGIISSFLTCCVIARTAILMLIFSVLVFGVYDFILIIIGKKSKKTLILYGILILSAVVFLLNIENIAENNIYIKKMILRFDRFDISSNVRFNKWIEYFKTSKLPGSIFGNGKGFSQNLRNSSFRLETDSQYVCYVLESGIIGTLIFLWILFEVSLKQFFKKQFNLEAVMLCIIVASYLIAGVTMEVFQTVLQASLFWCVVGTWYKYNELSQEEEVLLLVEKQSE